MISNNLLYPLISGGIGIFLVFMISKFYSKKFEKIVKFIETDKRMVYSILAFFVFVSITYFFMMIFYSDRGYITPTEAGLVSGILALFILLARKSKTSN